MDPKQEIEQSIKEGRYGIKLIFARIVGQGVYIITHIPKRREK